MDLTTMILIVLQFALAGWLSGYSYGCQLVDYSNDPKAVRVSKTGLHVI